MKADDPPALAELSRRHRQPGRQGNLRTSFFRHNDRHCAVNAVQILPVPVLAVILYFVAKSAGDLGKFRLHQLF